jgi:DNA-binding transcriptional MerR regulator
MPTHTPQAAEPGATERYSIDELATLAGVTPRTVRYYIQQGPRQPAGRRQARRVLRARHIEQLLLIRRWTDAGLSLERVRELIGEHRKTRLAAPCRRDRSRSGAG